MIFTFVDIIIFNNFKIVNFFKKRTINKKNSLPDFKMTRKKKIIFCFKLTIIVCNNYKKINYFYEKDFPKVKSKIRNYKKKQVAGVSKLTMNAHLFNATN